MKVSKVVLIVVALHVLVIGGIFVFEGCSRVKTPGPEMASDDMAPATQAAADMPALPADTSMVPSQPAPIAAAATPSNRSYTVKKGDSLWKIAKTEGVSIGDIARANNLNKTTALKVGQKLQIPAKAEPVIAQASAVPTATGETAAPVSAAIPTEGNLYIVKSGDSLWKIARSQSVTVAALKQANSLSSDSLKVGQKLHLPTAAATPTAQAGISTASYNEWTPGPVTENGQQFHIVDIGESPASIAKLHGIKTDELMRANGITDAKRIYVGQKLTIPTQTVAPAAVTAITPPAAAPIVSAKSQ